MANKFILWCEDENATQDYNTFANDSQRQAGFQGGQPASAIRVNTALRQANLVSAALMNALLPDNQTLNYRNDIPTVANAINTALTNKIQTTKVNNADNADNANKINNLSITETNNVLTNGTKIIQQKILVWSGSLGSGNSEPGNSISPLPFTHINNAKYEIHFQSYLIGQNDIVGYLDTSLTIDDVHQLTVPSIQHTVDTNNKDIMMFTSTLFEMKAGSGSYMRIHPQWITSVMIETSKFAQMFAGNIELTKIYQILE